MNLPSALNLFFLTKIVGQIHEDIVQGLVALSYISIGTWANLPSDLANCMIDLFTDGSLNGLTGAENAENIWII